MLSQLNSAGNNIHPDKNDLMLVNEINLTLKTKAEVLNNLSKNIQIFCNLEQQI